MGGRREGPGVEDREGSRGGGEELARICNQCCFNRLTPEIKFAITCAYSEIVYKKS